ncbi:ABC transporter permease [Rhodocytophaga rosea]|nr:FtsX-like permease family protein [Rhodocytophaga rosea]
MNLLFNPWLWQMAWRDSRKSRQRLLLFISSIVLGIAALVAINSFAYNLEKSIDGQAKELLGADLVLTTNKEITTEAQNLIDSIGTNRSEEKSFPSMVFFPKTKGTRLIQVKAVKGDFPYYGIIETMPASAAQAFKNSRSALVEDALMIQYNVKPGDSVKIGNMTFYIQGRLLKVPGQSAIATTVAPAVYIPLQYLEQTGLVQRGSRITSRFYYKLPSTLDVEKMAETLEPRLDREGINYDTVEERKQEVGRTFANLSQFLNLVGFVALLLGCVGVASAIHLYVKEKISSVAVLRCLGASGWQTFFIFLIETIVMGLIGATLGAALGTGIQFLLPQVFQDFLPVEVELTVAWGAVLQGVGIGLGMAILFALLPLLSIRRISPLRTLRASYEEDTSARDPAKWLVYGLIVLFVGGFAYLQIKRWELALGFTVGIAVAFLILTGMGKLIMFLVRKFFPVSWSYVWRQSLANLYRPQNQTLILIIAIGLGTFLISTLYLSQNLLLNQVSLSGSGNQPNMVLFDIQSNQKEQVTRLATEYNLPLLQQAPIVTMRLSEINGRSVDALLKDTTAKIPEWGLTREYRVTYRDSLISSEKLVQGKLHTYASPTDTIYVSVEEPYLQRMKLKVGDELVFNVQGAPVRTRVGSTREIEWNRVQTNFLVVFPEGVLEDAPQFHVLITRVDSVEQSAQFQQALVQSFPNVSAIDLGLILRTIDEILDKVSFVIRFMALFSIITGLIVLGSSVVISKYQRIQESVLLRTLGASGKQIMLISLIEYLFLGALATLSGILLSLLSTWLLALFVFETPFVAVYTPLIVVLFIITALTVLIGMLNSREVLNRPPLEVLRAEV